MTLNRMWLGLVAGLLFLVMGGSLIYTTLENQELKEKLAETQPHLVEEGEGGFPQSEEKSPTEKPSESPQALFVSGVFQRFLPYNERTYLSRFDAVEENMTADVLEGLKDMVATINPGISVQNTLHQVDVYAHGTNVNTFLVIATVSLEVSEGVDSTYTQVYQASVEEVGDTYRINRIASLGGIAPFDRE